MSNIQGLGQVGAHPGRQEPLNLPGGGVGAQDDHRRLPELGIAVELTQHLFSRDIGEVQVQQNQVWPVLSRQRESKTSLHRGDELDPWAPGHRSLHQAQVREVVLDVEHRTALL